MRSNPLKAKYHALYWSMAHAAEAQSEAKREQVGCVIVTPVGVVLPGWNGQPAGHPTNCCENTEVLEPEGPHGILTPRMKTDRSVLHAENNALGKALRAGVSLEGAYLFSTVSPCDVCARSIVPSGITHVFYAREHDDLTGVDMLLSAGLTAVRQDEIPHMIAEYRSRGN